MIPRFSFLLALLALLAPVRGQDQPVHMTPEFALTFPVTSAGKDVTVKYPILINPTTVLKPGMVLRVMYVLTTANMDGSSDLVLAHKGNMDQAFARGAGGSGDQESKMPPEMAHELEGYRRTVWEIPNNFVLAMAQLPTDSMHLIFCPGKDNRALRDERFSFFDGLLVGLPDGKVTVIAVEKESKADEAGLKAGDEIISVGGAPTQNDLATFAADYARAKKVAKDNEVSTYPMTIRPQGQGDARQINIPMPPRIKGGLMEGF